MSDMNQIVLRDDEHRDPSKLRRRSTTLVKVKKPETIAPKEYVVKITNVRLLRDGKLVEDDLWMSNGKIISGFHRFYGAKAPEEYYPDLEVDGQGAILSPGFIEVQINGAWGIDFANIDCTLDDVQEVGKNLLQYGVTSFCPTIVTSPAEKYHATLPRFVRYRGCPDRGAHNIGVHCEGPFMSMLKKGAHDPKQIENPTKGFASLEERYGDLSNVAVVTIAAELEGALDAIKGLKQKGIVVSMGHSNANIAESLAGAEAGATMITHMYNAMQSFHHRDPGLVGMLGDKEHKLYYGIIADGIHAHPNAVRIAWESHPDGCMLVTDAMAAMGLPEGHHKLGDMDVEVVGIKCTIAGTNTLAGAAVDHVTCIKNFRDFTGCTTEQVLECATLHPARAMGIEDVKGVLKPGADADLVLLNDNLDVLATFVDGQVGYVREGYTLKKSEPKRK